MQAQQAAMKAKIRASFSPTPEPSVSVDPEPLFREASNPEGVHNVAFEENTDAENAITAKLELEAAQAAAVRHAE